MDIYGINAVLEALRTGGVRDLRVSDKGGARLAEVLDAASVRGIPVRRVPSAQLERAARGGVHQGVVATIEAPAAVGVLDLVRGASGAPLLVVLDGVDVTAQVSANALTVSTQGSHTVVVTDTDLAGNATSTSYGFTLDTTAPAATTVVMPATSAFASRTTLEEAPSERTSTPLTLPKEASVTVPVMASGAAGLSLAAWAQRDARASLHRPGKLAPIEAQASSVSGAVVMDKVTPYTDASTYNNFYEFGTDKSDPARNAHTLVTSPWQIQIDGLVKKPGPLDLAELLKLSPMEERIYRMRCVEGWSMVIPWVGYSLSALIRRVEPLGSAKFVQFETLADRKTMPYVGSRVLDWPYVEGLRLDEAMHPLTLLTFGMYGEVLPKQNGAPVRLVVPWKYGFKNAKSLVRIRFTEQMPPTAWNKAAANEYGFYSNVNPNVDHPRWSQATERRLGEDGLLTKKRKTLMFNGYEAQVGQLYAGMDLRKNY